MKTTWIKVMSVGATGALALSACGSSKTSSSPAGGSSSTSSSATAQSSGGAATKTVTVGVLTDLTGVASSGFQTTEKGIKAGLSVASSKGLKVNYVMADSQSTPAGALVAAQQLVNQDHVFAIVDVSAFFFGAAQYLLEQHVPVVGGGWDGGPGWSSQTYTNLYNDRGNSDFTKVATTYGTVFKELGVTNLGVLGYGASPSSAGAASGSALSSQAAGIKVGYQNLNFTFGSTDVQPVAIAMKNAGVDGIFVVSVPSTAFALAAALHSLGVNLKMTLLATGYGGDLLQSPAGVQAAQGDSFDLAYQPVELHTQATQQFQSALGASTGAASIPTFAEYEAYIGIAAVVDGLLKAGSNPTVASFGQALRNDASFDGFGLFGSHTVNFSQYGTVVGGLGPDNCEYFTTLSGTAFKLATSKAPSCGTIIPGMKASTGG